MSNYRTSPHVQLLDLDERTTLAGHPFHMNLGVLDRDVVDVLRALRERPGDLEDLRRRLTMPSEHIERVLHFLQAQRFVLAEEADEEREIRDHARRLRDQHIGKNPIVSWNRDSYDSTPLLADIDSGRVPHEEMTAVKFLILGGCLTQLAADALSKLAPAYGIRAEVDTHWPQVNSTSLEGADVIVFQPSTVTFLQVLWDDGPFLTDHWRAQHLQVLKQQLALWLHALQARPKSALLLAQGFSTPVHSPLGRTEFRCAQSYYQIVHELNQVVIDAIKDDRNALLIDEERLLSAVGKSRLMDHAVSTFSHHGPIDAGDALNAPGPSREETFGVSRACHAPQLFARAYLESFVMWKGIGLIKCIIVDLDNTLWPGLAGEGGFSTDNALAYLTYRYGVFGGIHQALKIAKKRGALLATCSKNDERDVWKAWEELETFATQSGLNHVLRREDFVLHKVNWQRKSVNVRAIMQALGTTAAATLFIDDSAVERAEVQSVFPLIRTLGGNMNLVRSALLNDPCLQRVAVTEESANRTEMVRAQLQRDALLDECPDEEAFLRTLDIRLKITKVRTSQRLPRILELIARTNQFNTTLVRFEASELQEYIDGPHSSIHILEASDRFTSYGLVGACILCNAEIKGFILSCRILPLRAEIPFLCTALIGNGQAPILGPILEAPRNQPCRQLYRQARFDEIRPGTYLLPELSRLPPIDDRIYRIEYLEESCTSPAVAG